jgi:hypothetical protein
MNGSVHSALQDSQVNFTSDQRRLETQATDCALSIQHFRIMNENLFGNVFYRLRNINFEEVIKMVIIYYFIILLYIYISNDQTHVLMTHLLQWRALLVCIKRLLVYHYISETQKPHRKF